VWHECVAAGSDVHPDHLRDTLYDVDWLLDERAEIVVENEEAWRLGHDLEEARREIDRLQHEVMAHQVGAGYEKGHEHGSLTAAKFQAERDAARRRVAELEAVLWELELASWPPSSVDGIRLRRIVVRALEKVKQA
jgi:flagellar biosynthesis/type III secretory pathway protein FliH